MTAAHDWKADPRSNAPNGSYPAYRCRRDGCGATYDGVQGICLAPSALSSRLDALLDEARALSIDLRTARDAAPDGGKAGYRLANQRVEQAIAKLAQAAEVKL